MENDIQVGMAVSGVVGMTASTTASGMMGAQVIAALNNQGVKATMEGPATLETTFHAKAVPEQSERSLARALTVAPSVAPTRAV